MGGTESREPVKSCPRREAEWTSELQGERYPNSPRRDCRRYQVKGIVVRPYPQE
jgi:hypothetical protein